MTARQLSKSHKENISKALKGKYAGKKSWHYGKHWSKSHREKISKAERGKYNPNYGKHPSRATRAMMSKAHIGKHLSYDTKLKLSKSHKGKRFSRSHRENMSKYHADFSGKNSPNWLGGKSFEPYSTDFNERLKREIRERDNYACQLCGKKGKTVHHISYNKNNNRKSNLCVLCNSCNVKVNVERPYYTRLFHKILRMISKKKKRVTVYSSKHRYIQLNEQSPRYSPHLNFF
ncbi:NUMOD3 domain-containing DNA-binding protein [Candidatus Bathyarchaeota archaeon]|nr:NUMOD3 domain-containing DNA-binding protein [Candidatus Bathyarchaeota archaeon]